MLPLLAELRKCGKDPGDLGVDLQSIADPDARIPLAWLDPMWHRAASISGDPDFGLHAAETVADGAFGIIYYVGAASPTFGEGLERVCRYFRIFSDASAYHLDVTDDVATVVATQDVPIVGPVRHRVEFTIAVLYCYSRRHVDAEWTPLDVFFEHPQPDDTSEHRRIFGCPIRFGAPLSGFRFDSALLGRRLVGSDSSLAGIIETVARNKLSSAGSGTLAQALRQVLVDAGPGSDMTLAAAARRLGMSLRTLQRRLTDEGTTAKKIFDDVRFHLAARMLRRPEISLAEIAFALGFSEPAALCRAFKRWTGRTPSAYRRSG